MESQQIVGEIPATFLCRPRTSHSVSQSAVALALALCRSLSLAHGIEHSLSLCLDVCHAICAAVMRLDPHACPLAIVKSSTNTHLSQAFLHWRSERWHSAWRHMLAHSQLPPSVDQEPLSVVVHLRHRASLLLWGRLEELALSMTALRIIFWQRI